MSSNDSNVFQRVESMPLARTSELVVQKLKNEMLVYDLTADKAHHLNETVSIIWKKCDGKTRVKELALSLEKQLNSKIEEDFIWLAIDELAKASLLQADISTIDSGKLSRRNVLFKYAPMAVAIPVVMSLVAPPAVHAQSCITAGNPCTPFGAPCCPTLACEGPTCA